MLDDENMLFMTSFGRSPEISSWEILGENFAPFPGDVIFERPLTDLKTSVQQAGVHALEFVTEPMWLRERVVHTPTSQPCSSCNIRINSTRLFLDFVLLTLAMML